MKQHQPDSSEGSANCHECGQTLNEEYRDTLIIRIIGGYGTFADPMDYEEWGNTPLAVIYCHDCAANLFRHSKGLQKIYGSHSLHSFIGDERCCEYGWELADYKPESQQRKPETEWATPPYQPKDANKEIC